MTQYNTFIHSIMTQQLLTVERQRIRTLIFDGNYTKREVQRITSYTAAQIRSALKSEIPAPRSGRPTAMTPDEEFRLVSLVIRDSEHRFMS
jgi:hypothetical protein